MDRGRVIVPNGPSSAGKSTLANAVRSRVGPSMAAVSIDRFFAFMHPDTRNNWHLFATLTDALFSTAVAISNGGFDVVVDTVFVRVECVQAMQVALSDRPYRLVAVTCPLDVLEMREHERGNRRIGQPREQQDPVLAGAAYDLRVDTNVMSLDECVDRVVALLS